MAPVVERIPEIPNLVCGEGPHWDPVTESLYLVSIPEKAIFKYVPATKKVAKVVFDKPVSFIVPVKDTSDKFVISLERQLALITWDGESDKVSDLKIIGEVDVGTTNRINDAKCDPSGRLWFGTMGEELEPGHFTDKRGSLFSLENNKITKHTSQIGISNGLAWSVDLKKMYYIDSLARTVDQFDFDIAAGTISNRKPIFTFEKHGLINDLPDGMTTDVNGNLWVACFNGHKVIKIDPRKPETLLETLAIPANQVTSVAFGGPNLDELYVTSGCATVDGVVLPPPDHGALFKVTGLNIKGFQADNCVL